MDLNKKIKNSIDSYLEFDSDLLFNKQLTITIFGGAVRDSISGDEINDIDILCGPNSRVYLENTLKENGYKYIESLQPKDISNLYSDIHIICEPHTWIKNAKIIQIIRPRISEITATQYENEFNQLISNVDISCCSLSYNGNFKEHYKNALIHCLNKVYYVNPYAKMYSHSRIEHRIHKFDSRGWTKLESNDMSSTREEKLKYIL